MEVENSRMNSCEPASVISIWPNVFHLCPPPAPLDYVKSNSRHHIILVSNKHFEKKIITTVPLLHLEKVNIINSLTSSMIQCPIFLNWNCFEKAFFIISSFKSRSKQVPHISFGWSFRCFLNRVSLRHPGWSAVVSPQLSPTPGLKMILLHRTLKVLDYRHEPPSPAMSWLDWSLSWPPYFVIYLLRKLDFKFILYNSPHSESGTRWVLEWRAGTLVFTWRTKGSS